MPTKLFEYMATGLPVIASNFPHWKEILEDNHCGLVVDPLNPKEIARAIEYLLDHPEEASRMGENGRQAVKDKYNWEEEGKKLLDLYERLLTERKSYRRGAHKRQRERTRG
jgi:glycosyltransferase involved in cell wall biosynthesis